MSIQPKNNGKMSDQQRVDPFELPDPDEWSEDEEEEYQLPKPGDIPNTFEQPEDCRIFEDELHDKWDWSSQPIYQ